MAVYENIGCARISVTIRNLTKNPIVINRGMLTIHNTDGEELTRHGVDRFNKILLEQILNYLYLLWKKNLEICL